MTLKEEIWREKEKKKAARTSIVEVCGQERRYLTTQLFYVKKLSGVKKGRLCVEDKHNVQGERGVQKLGDAFKFDAFKLDLASK